MKFQTMSRCHRSEAEQRYIWAAMAVFPRLPEERRQAARALVEDIADTPVEARALFDVAVRGQAPQRVWERTGVALQRLYRMREAFYDRLPL